MLVHHKADLNVACSEIKFYTPLHILLSIDKPPFSLVKLLVENGANVNTKNDSGKTPLHLAAFWGHNEVAKYLIEKNADVNATTNKGRTALELAALYGHSALATWLARKMNKPIPEIKVITSNKSDENKK